MSEAVIANINAGFDKIFLDQFVVVCWNDEWVCLQFVIFHTIPLVETLHGASPILKYVINQNTETLHPSRLGLAEADATSPRD